MRRRKGLSPEDRDLWSRVARTAVPLDPKRKGQAADLPQLSDLPPARPAASLSVSPASAAAASAAMPRFRIGQGAGTLPAQIARPSTPAERLAQAGLRMDAKTHRKMSQGRMMPEARLDLHGLTLSAAQPELMHFILSCQASGLRLVLVITGKGRGDHGPLPTRPGALRHQVPYWLHSPPLSAAVQQVTAAHYRHGGEGAYYVYLRRFK
ncbi:DNA mismatch repair protein MutS [Paracoccus liaowanqingii]|uniref:DNA mismatch repair protein MutS n=1 Tax=Paracoccus liaowanqingii TaxID=2560053 RepID=A0A4Z1CQD1_9RHOB|nr:Smr/MutS family protein [Paracoccus liaowanqingii]TGN67232.1 DNA mismatch repair protein MutS [Paracoccus liaowanqingii]